MADYDSIKASVKAFISDDYADFDGQIDEMTINAEKRISRELSLPAQMTWKDDATLTQGTATLDLQSDAIGSIHFFSITDANGDQIILERRTPSFIRDYWTDPTETGVPKYYAEYDADTVLLGPTPNFQVGSTDYPYTMLYDVRVGGLTASGVTTTWLSLNAEDVLIYAILHEGAMFHKDGATAGEEGSQAFYEKEYQKRLASLAAEVGRVLTDRTNTHKSEAS